METKHFALELMRVKRETSELYDKLFKLEDKPTIQKDEILRNLRSMKSMVTNMIAYFK